MITLSDIFIGNFPISQGYGVNPDYYKQFGLSGHEGIDFATPVGTPIISSCDGVVVRDQDDPKSGAYGIHVVVWDQTQSCATWYCHLDKNVVSVGQKIVKGQLLGYSGNTGNSSGPHLHFNLCKTDANGNRLNTNNGYSGFINANDGRIAKWDIQNLTKPIEPPSVTVPLNTADEDMENGLSVLVNYRNTRVEGKQDNFEGYARVLVDRDSKWKQLQTDLENTQKKNEELTKQVQELTVKLSGAQAAITEYQKGIDALWEKLDPISGEKNMATIASEVQQLIVKEYNYIKALKNSEDYQQKYVMLLNRLQDMTHTSTSQESDVLEELERQLASKKDDVITSKGSPIETVIFPTPVLKDSSFVGKLGGTLYAIIQKLTKQSGPTKVV